MDETLGSALPPIAEDHLWTSDWGMPATPAPNSGLQQAGTDLGVNPSATHGQRHQSGPMQGQLQQQHQHQQSQQEQQEQQRSMQQQYAGEFGWMGDWQTPQDGVGMNVDDADGCWTFPFV